MNEEEEDQTRDPTITNSKPSTESGQPQELSAKPLRSATVVKAVIPVLRKNSINGLLNQSATANVA
jgi:hypothetical protein